MKPERRCTSRERPIGLTYIQFEPEGGGIVVDASEQGLAFHAAAALHQSGPIRLCVSPNPMQQIRLIAEIVWMDEANKSGGLRFTELTADARDQIVQWLSQTNEPLATGRTSEDQFCELPGESSWGFPPRNEAPDLQLLGSDDAMSNCSIFPTPPASQGRNIKATELPRSAFSQESYISTSRPRLLPRLATGLMILVCLFTPVFLWRNFRYQIGNSLIHVGEKLRGNGDTQSEASSPVSSQTSNLNSESAPLAPKPVRDNSADKTSDQSHSAASSLTTARIEKATDFGVVERQNSQQKLADSHSRAGRSALARQLWSKVGAGDSSAEVALAQLYIKGDGVTRNCEQAQVLLGAASKKGNIEAMQQLRKVKSGGCR
jgi:hypothetical protein